MPTSTNYRIAIVVSSYNAEITQALLQGTVSQLTKHQLNQDNLKIIEVPGAVEIPLTAKWLAQTKQFDAIICLGAVIQGETDHYDYVCDQVSQGCQRIMLDYNIPVIFGVLTTKNVEQARDRSGGKHGHKGIEAADAAMKMIAIKADLMKSLSLRTEGVSVTI